MDTESEVYFPDFSEGSELDRLVAALGKDPVSADILAVAICECLIQGVRLAHGQGCAISQANKCELWRQAANHAAAFAADQKLMDMIAAEQRRRWN